MHHQTYRYAFAAVAFAAASSTWAQANASCSCPRSIGIADLGDRFVISFMDAPMKPANEAMQAWALALRNRPPSDTGVA